MQPKTNTATRELNTPRAKKQLQQLADDLRASVPNLDDPRGQALFETSAEVLLGLKNAFDDYTKQNEPAWRGEPEADSSSSPQDTHTTEDEYNTLDATFRRHYQSFYKESTHSYDYYAPAYRFGFELAKENSRMTWGVAKATAQERWRSSGHTSNWGEVVNAIHIGWKAQRNRDSLRVHHDPKEKDGYDLYHNSFQSHYAQIAQDPTLTLAYEDVEPAYHYGYTLGREPTSRSRCWDEIESEVRKYYETEYRDGQLAWRDYRDAVQYAWRDVRSSDFR